MNKPVEILKLIESGEGQNLEFNSSFNAEVIETLVCFANTSGGKVIIGINGKHEFSGLKMNAESGQAWVNEIKTKTQPSLMPDFETYFIDKKHVAVLSVHEYPIKPIAVKGRCFKRIGNSNHLMSIQEVADMQLRTFNTSWDNYVTHQYSMDEISLEKVSRFINEANRTREISITDEPLTVLKKLELISEARPTNACLLLFTGIELFQLTVMAGRFSDPVSIKDSATIRSDLFSQIGLIMDFIKKHINKEFIITGEPQHEERWQYPLNAVREIVINMIVHRNYQDPNDSIIKIYNDRIEFFNPGKLMEPLTIDRLLSGEYSSVVRNKNIAAIFKEAGLIEKYGSGIQRILLSFKQYGLNAPVFQDFQHGFRVVIYARTEKITPQDAIQDTVQGTMQDTMQDTMQVKLLLTIVDGEMTRGELQEKLQLKNRDYFRKHYLIPALESNLIEMTHPDKPNSRHQKYRLTEKGKQMKRNSEMTKHETK